MNIDRDAQFAPFIALVPQLLAATKTFDSATNTLEAQKALVAGIEAQMRPLGALVQDRGGATPEQFIQFYTLQIQHNAEYPKIATLFQAATDAHMARVTLWANGFADYQGLLNNPGAVEKV